MGTLTRWLLSFFLSTWGIAVLAALDSSVLFSVPFALDAAVVLLAAHHRDLFWLYPLIVVPASMVGAASTYWLGKKLGEEGLDRFVAARRLKGVQDRVRRSRAFALAALDLVPPPFPFTPVILVSGALKVAPRSFFITLAWTRLIRFGSEAVLALFYGGMIVSWLKSETVRTIAGILFVLVLAGAAFSIYRIVRATSWRGTSRSVRRGAVGALRGGKSRA